MSRELCGEMENPTIFSLIKIKMYIWLIGGGFTPDWVHKELANSMEGALQALERIGNWLLD
jgi:hypothetical protein